MRLPPRKFWLVLFIALLVPAFQLLKLAVSRFTDFSSVEQTAKYSYDQGIEALARKEYDSAIVHFDQAVKSYKTLVSVEWERSPIGSPLLRDNEWDPGKALTFANATARALTNRGIAYQYKGKHEEALADYTRAIRLYRALGDDSNAQRDEQKVQELKESR